MSFANKAMSLAVAGLLLSTSAMTALAQAGGGDVPTGAKKQGEKEQPGSTGMSQGEAKGGSMKKDGAMEKKSGDKM